ncbi:19639_t:CDS:10 [Gigaspora margarita]|uniref:19639_t:CDS:1 n=1 Tax=Gigaspora margarita TaxID=4874 RepID=A0ABN7VIJ9_GIGMA|nr:19639_t:CDS:10 [Gigaspora margarita]
MKTDKFQQSKKKLPPIHPGEILRERLLVPLCEERADITPDLATRLALYFDSTVEFWLNLQRSYEEERRGEILNMPPLTNRKKFKKNVREYMEEGIKNVAETRQNLKIVANARDKRDFNMFAVEKGAKTALRLELIQGTKNYYSIRTGGQWRIFFVGGYHQGANSATNQLTLNQPDFTPYYPPSRIPHLETKIKNLEFLITVLEKRPDLDAAQKVNHDLTARTTERDNLQTNLKQTQANLTTAEKENHHTKIALKKEQIKFQQTASERDDYSKHRDKALTELSEERNNHYQTQQNLATTTEERNKVQAQQTKLARELASRQNENSKLVGKITHLESEVIQAGKQNAEKAAIINGLEAEKKAAQAGLEAFNQQLNEVNQELEQQNKSNLLERLFTSLGGVATGYAIKKARTEKEYEELTEEVEKLINHWRNHRCKTCPHNDYNTIKQERDNYKQQLDTHTCPTCPQTCCVNGDYDAIKEQLSQQAEQHQQQLTAKEKEIITQIISECQLGLNPDSVLEAVITRIKELINKDPDSQIAADLQQQLQDKDKLIADLSTPSEEIKQQLVKLCQELGLSDQVQQSLQSASNYSELVSKQDENYPIDKSGIIKLDISDQNLEGKLNLNDLANLEELDCSKNQLASLNLNNCPKLRKIKCYNNELTTLNLNNCFNITDEKLEKINLRDNKFRGSDLTPFSNFQNTQNAHNRFFGSLEPLQNLLRLEELDISNTDIGSGLKYLPDSIRDFRCSADRRPKKVNSKEVNKVIIARQAWQINQLVKKLQEKNIQLAQQSQQINDYQLMVIENQKQQTRIIELEVENNELREKLENLQVEDKKVFKNILLIGKTGNGKSTLANVLTGTNLFKESDSAVSETKEINSEEFECEGVNYRIIDTIGMDDNTGLTNEEILEKVAQATYSMKEGISQIMFVTSGRFDRSEMLAYSLLKGTIFDEKIAKYTTIVRTRSPRFEDNQ